MLQIKKAAKSFSQEFVYGGHLLSLGASGIVLSGILVFDLQIKLIVCIIAYLLSQIVYTYNHAREIRLDTNSNPERTAHLSSIQKWVEVSPFIYFVLLCISLPFSNLSTALLSGFIVLGGVLYTEYFKKFQILGFKSFYVAFFWSILVFVVPLFYELRVFLPFLYLAMFTFIRWLVNTIFFDIKDIESDKKEGVKTFAAYWGKKKTIFFLQAVNLISIVPLVLGVLNNHLPVIVLFLGAAILFGSFYLTWALYLNKRNLRTLSYIIVDSEYLLWPIMLLAGKLFI